MDSERYEAAQRAAKLDPVAHYRELKYCARCGETHRGITFWKFTRPNPDYCGWATCPTNGEPILLQLAASDGEQKGGEDDGETKRRD